MPPTSSSVQAARKRVADQLRALRLDARLSGRALAAAAGWHGVSKVSKIEHAVRPPSADDIRTWCRVCGAGDERAAALVAELHAAETMWQDWRAAERTGLMHLHRQTRDLYAETRLFRAYTSKIVPGLLQGAEYTRAILTALRDGRDVPVDDVEATVTERLRRQAILRTPGHRWVFVIEEAVLGYRVAGDSVMAAQLAHLVELAALPTVSVGIIPADADRHAAAPAESFQLWDDTRATTELVSGWLTVTQPSEVEMYARTFRALLALAVHGARARALITAAARAFR